MCRACHFSTKHVSDKPGQPHSGKTESTGVADWSRDFPQLRLAAYPLNSNVNEQDPDAKQGSSEQSFRH